MSTHPSGTVPDCVAVDTSHGTSHLIEPLGKLGSLSVRIAANEAEIAAAQALRHAIFKAEADLSPGEALPSQIERDEDHFDRYCDHLIVEDRSPDGVSQIVATYRLLGQERAEEAGGFYSQAEFDIAGLMRRHRGKRFLEFGRSCVLPEYRSKRTIELLWHGSWAYVRRNGFDVMFGCASFSGTDAVLHDEALAFLRQNAAPVEGWEVAGIGELAAMPATAKGCEPDMKRALRALPPLIKGYLRLGAMFTTDAVIDRDFGTLDVLVLLPLERLNPRYVNYYGADAERHRS